MEWLDWVIVGLYILAVMGMSGWIGRRQKSQADYYVAGRKLGPWTIALSIVATQCSANSLIGAPEFIALKENGGMSWLQYELAVPLAGIVIITLLPIFFRRRITTIYEAVEDRFGPAARSTLSGIFLFSRALGAAVTLYATAVVVSVCLGWNCQHPWAAIIFVGTISILYTTMGGIEADIYSDILQLVVLVAGTVVCIIVVLSLLEGVPSSFAEVAAERREVLDFTHHGFGDTSRYSFWPMLFGGLLLYISYYGCDQSQAQRLLSAKSVKTAQSAILLNSLLRFPLVLTYCGFGLLLAVWVARNPAFLDLIPIVEGKRQANFLVPLFIVEKVPMGIRGVIVAAIVAAAMSSLDSTMNSLSAATQRDFLERYVPSVKRSVFFGEVARARAITVFWGVVCTVFAFLFADTRQTVLELVNMIGSAVYGPILAVFLLILLRRRAEQAVIVIALLLGVAANAMIWQAPWLIEHLWKLFGATAGDVMLERLGGISWLWWNVSGTIVTFSLGMALSSPGHPAPPAKDATALGKAIALALAFVIIFIVLMSLNHWLPRQ